MECSVFKKIYIVLKTCTEHSILFIFRPVQSKFSGSTSSSRKKVSCCYYGNLLSCFYTWWEFMINLAASLTLIAWVLVIACMN